jgi:phenylpropionate dioxygenase-like ring-hydroxylating dioxygenase large terminal subunit
MTTTENRRISAEDPATMITVAEMLGADTRPVKPTLFERSVREYPDQDRVAAELFTSPEIARAEHERLWSRVWQLACLEQDVRHPGDYCEYVIGNMSILVVRGTDGRIRAFHNVCLHRGTRLKLGTGHSDNLDLRCPFHAWSWDLEGNLCDVPCRWDFPHVTNEDYGLPQVACETWKGLVFVNPDPEAAPLSDWIGSDLDHQMSVWPLEKRYKAAHVARSVNCNWKLALQAFMESYHIFRTHARAMRFVTDANVQYDAYGLHGRFITPTGTPSPHVRDDITDQDVVDAMMASGLADLMAGGTKDVEVPLVGEEGGARPVLAEVLRQALGGRLGYDFSAASDSEMLDAIGFPIFPNVVVFVGEELPVIYRARPDGDDPGRCLFEVIVHVPVNAGVELPPAPVHFLPEGDKWASAAELGGLGPIFDEDMSNLERIQLGFSSPGFPGPTFARSQEVLIRQFHHNLARWLER